MAMKKYELAPLKKIPALPDGSTVIGGGGCVVASAVTIITIKNVQIAWIINGHPEETLHSIQINVSIPIIIKFAGGVTSWGDPSKKVAKQTTSAPLYSGIAGIVSVSISMPLLSRMKPLSMSGYSLEDDPFISQLIPASIR